MASLPRKGGNALSVTGGVTLGFGVLVFALLWFNAIKISCPYVGAIQLIVSMVLFAGGALALIFGLVMRHRGKY